MKQRGKSWITHEGRPTEAKYLPPYIKIQEQMGQKIAEEAVALHKRMIAAKQMFLDSVKKAYRETPGTAETRTRFSFTTFDKEYRIEWDMRDDHIRVYQATRKNPTQKDYVFLDLSMAGIKPLLLTQIEQKEESDAAAPSATADVDLLIDMQSPPEENDAPEIPLPIQRCVDTLIPLFNGLEGHFLQSEDDFATWCHSQLSGGIGMKVRNLFDLHNFNNDLGHYLKAEHGCADADAMSNLILRHTYRYLRPVLHPGKPIKEKSSLAETMEKMNGHSKQSVFDELKAEGKLVKGDPDAEEEERVEILTGKSVYERNLEGIDQERSGAYTKSAPADQGDVLPQSADGHVSGAEESD